MNDWFGVIICLTYVFAIIGLAEGLRQRRNYSTDFTRKVVHIGVGMMSWAVPVLFTSPWPFIALCALFVVINYLDWRYGFFASMGSKERGNPGTVYFPVAAGAVVFIFWEQPPLMVAALMPLTWGDGLAPVIGRAYGRHSYTIFGHTRTLQGSAGFFAAGLLFTWLALWIMEGPPAITPWTALLPAVLVSGGASLAEAVTVGGFDNLSITAVAILILSLWSF